jgi:hypothetical protein
MNAHIYETVKDIEDIVNEKKVKNFNLSKEDEYQRLMNKEDKMINLLEDMQSTKKKKETNYDFLISSPIHVVIFKLYTTILDIISDLKNANEFMDVFGIFLKKDRVLYTGIIFLLISILLMFVNL